MIGGDPRRFYYPFMVFVAVVISAIIFQALPTELLQWSANMSNLAALIMPFALMYLIGKPPRPAKAKWWSNVILTPGATALDDEQSRGQPVLSQRRA